MSIASDSMLSSHAALLLKRLSVETGITNGHIKRVRPEDLVRTNRSLGLQKIHRGMMDSLS